ncbi:MAG TPA: hypothetical protein PLR25_14815 [Planctomycetaceae bacterium]|nr:hypothetical protein [Planctomycetaceae bacterium]
MSTAFQIALADQSAARMASLLQTLNELLRAVDSRVVLLRPLTASFDSQSDDLDLLLTESQRQQLICAAKAACHQGQIHCRIRQTVAAKAELTLWTIDCSQRLMIDLWTSFDQLPHQQRKSISATRLLNTLSPLTLHSETNPAHEAADPRIPALRQLPPDIDLCLLLQHVSKKSKSLSVRTVRERITAACGRLAVWSPDPATMSVPHDMLAALRELARELDNAIIITRNNIALTERYLVLRLAAASGNRGLRILEPRRSRRLLTDLRKAIMKRLPCLAVIGSDGAGKSSLVKAFAKQQPTVQPVVAKKFYRRSLSYQIITGLFKRLGGLDRGVFDDRCASIVTLRAIPAAWIKLLLRLNPFSRNSKPVPPSPSIAERARIPEAMILDRSVSSFLIADRKSDTPTLTCGATWIESLIPPVTSVLMMMPWDELTRHKQELSACGHEQYQRLLFEQAQRQSPMDIMLLARTESAEAAAKVIAKIFEADPRSVRDPETRSHTKRFKKAAA